MIRTHSSFCTGFHSQTQILKLLDIAGHFCCVVRFASLCCNVYTESLAAFSIYQYQVSVKPQNKRCHLDVMPFSFQRTFHNENGFYTGGFNSEY